VRDLVEVCLNTFGGSDGLEQLKAVYYCSDRLLHTGVASWYTLPQALPFSPRVLCRLQIMDAESVPNAVRTIVKDAEANLTREISDFVGPLWGKKYCVAVYTDSDDGLLLYWTYSRLCKAPKGVVQARCVLDHHPTATLRGPTSSRS
jgi:hypothetical protein